MSAAADNLKPYRWKPGQSGNPRGRVARPSFEAVVRQILDEKVTVPEQIARQMGLEPAAPGADVVLDKREVLARVFVHEMIFGKNRHLMALYLEREWPKLTLLEVAARLGMQAASADPENLAAVLNARISARAQRGRARGDSG